MNNNVNADIVHVEKLIAGDVSAFRYFIRTYQDMAFILAVSIVKDEYLAQEVAQDAFMKAFRSIGSFNRLSSFKTWFYRILVNTAFLALKRMKRDKLQFFEGYDADIADVDLSHDNLNEQIEMVNKAFVLMPPNEALVLRLFYLEEESIKDVCAVTGFTEANVKVLLHRGRKRMYAIIEQQKMKK
jgi:RNA polymerase sigma factor (sigma-70 family)